MFKHPSKSTIDRISTYIEKYNKGKGKYIGQIYQEK